jgi:hypothetical protein
MKTEENIVLIYIDIRSHLHIFYISFNSRLEKLTPEIYLPEYFDKNLVYHFKKTDIYRMLMHREEISRTFN